MQPPNLLLITTDQQSATMMSCAGNPDLHTPNLDHLAACGIRFEKAYAAQPLCVPQRNCWYSGAMPHENGLSFNYRLNQRELQAPIMMGKIFQQAGYATGYSGKWHVNVSEKDQERHGFQWMNNIRANGADQGIAPDFDRFLQETAGQPFLFSASYNNPHNICEGARGGPFPDGHPGFPENLGAMPSLPENFEIPEEEPTVLRDIQRRYSEKNYPTGGWDTMRWRLHRWMYARMVELVDRHIGNLLQVLRDHGLEEDTLIVFASDHGDGNAHHRWNQKQSLYDESARVPFMIANLGSEGGGVNTDALVNTGIDLIPTLCGLSGVEIPDHLKGVDWSPVYRSGEVVSAPDHLVVETEFGTFGASSGILGRAIRTQRYKYMIYNQGTHREFLVDMEEDPGETVNLANDPRAAEVLEQHRGLLREYIEQTHDLFPLDRIHGGDVPVTWRDE